MNKNKITKYIVYVSSYESRQIHVWKLNIDYTLTLVQVINTPGQVRPITISTDKNFLYVGVRPEYRVIAYRISNCDGSLSLLKELPLPGSPTHISTDRKGFFLFVSSYNSNCIIVIRLEKSMPVEIIDIVEELDGCHSANLSPYNQTLWVPALKKDCIFLFTLSDNGKLISQIPQGIRTVNGAGPRHLVFHPKYKYSYVLNELHGSVDVWDFTDPHSSIQCIQTVNIMPTDFSGISWAADIHISPNGCNLYTCDRSSSILTILNISKNGRTLKVEGFQSTEAQPRAFNIDDRGKILISAGQKSNYIAVYEIIDSQGFLKNRGRYLVGKDPTWVIVHALAF